ncbi:hypothetical protein [Oceanithermus sp.]
MRYSKNVADNTLATRLQAVTDEALEGFVRQMNRYLQEPVSRETFDVEVLTPPHFPRALPGGKQAVFAFYWPERERFITVAIAGPNSNARFQSQHYLPASSGSNLARKLLQHREDLGLEDIDEHTVGLWMKGNLARVNIYLPAAVGREVLKYLKDYLKLVWEPIF